MQFRDARMTGFPTMRVPGIGVLTNVGDYWRLVYDGCGHGQEFPQVDLEQPQQAVQHIRRHYAECLTCRLHHGMS